MKQILHTQYRKRTSKLLISLRSAQADLHQCCPLISQTDFLKTKLKHPLLMCFILVDIQTHLITVYQTLHYLFIFYFHFIFLLFQSKSLKQNITHASMEILSYTSKDFNVQNIRKKYLQLCKYQVNKMAVHDIKFDAIAIT